MDASSIELLDALQRQMEAFYRQPRYHDCWISGCNADWREGNEAQLGAVERIAPGSTVVEIGYGDGAAASEIRTRVRHVTYIGIDLAPRVPRSGDYYAAARAQALPLRSRVADIVVSFFTIEHLVYPAASLDEMWRILKPRGRLLVIAPDFCTRGMSSEKAGFSYGSGRQKIARGRLLDALVTGIHTRIRIPRDRGSRNTAVASGGWLFPVLLNPRCFQLEGFVPDCDAVYPACPEEIVNYIRSKSGFDRWDIYHRDANSFGLEIVKN